MAWVAGVSDGPPHTTPGVDALEEQNMYLGCSKSINNILYFYL